MKTNIYMKLGIYLVSFITVCGPSAHANCYWENGSAAAEEANQLAAAAGDRGRIAIQTQAKAQSEAEFKSATSGQSLADKNNKNIKNLIARLQVAVSSLSHLTSDFSADEGGRAALALAVADLPAPGSQSNWMNLLKRQMDDIALTDSLRMTVTGILNAFLEDSPDPRIRLQDANLALKRALSAKDAEGARTGIDITADTIAARIQEATGISQAADETLKAANKRLSDAQAQDEHLKTVLGWLNKDLADEEAAARAAGARKGDWECPQPLPKHVVF